VAAESSARSKHQFAGLTDPRGRKVVHRLINLLTIALSAVIAGADGFVTIAAWARPKRTGLATILALTGDVPAETHGPGSQLRKGRRSVIEPSAQSADL